MATGLSNQCTAQLGEHLVAAELARRGFLVTTFAGNVPDFDIVAVKGSKRVLVQVKATTLKSWILNPKRFMTIRLDGESQHFECLVEPRYDAVINVFVKVGKSRDKDEFYVLPWNELRDVVKRTYFPSGLDRRRPEKHDSFHFAVSQDDLRDYSGWDRLPV